MSALVGLDPSKSRLGWAIVIDVATDCTLIAHGCERLDRKGGGWLEHQVREALATVATRAYLIGPGYDVTRWVREEPITRHPRTAKDHGAVCHAVDAGCRRLWPWASFWTLMPAEWRKLVGMSGHAPKEAVREWAVAWCWELGIEEPATQDAADAIVIGRAAWVQLATRGMVEQ